MNEKEVNLDLQESAGYFIKLADRAQGSGTTLAPAVVVLTLPLMSSEIAQGLEAAAAAAAFSFV